MIQKWKKLFKIAEQEEKGKLNKPINYYFNPMTTIHLIAWKKSGFVLSWLFRSIEIIQISSPLYYVALNT